MHSANVKRSFKILTTQVLVVMKQSQHHSRAYLFLVTFRQCLMNAHQIEKSIYPRSFRPRVNLSRLPLRRRPGVPARTHSRSSCVKHVVLSTSAFGSLVVMEWDSGTAISIARTGSDTAGRLPAGGEADVRAVAGSNGRVERGDGSSQVQ